MTATPERPPASGTARASAVLGLVTRAADAHRRTDLESLLRRAGERLAGADVHVLIAGEFKQGKTSLVNALLNVRLPADPAIGSARPVVVSNGSEPTCRLVAPDGATTIDAAGAAAAITTPGPGHVELVVPRRVLAGGLVVIDTPGAGGFNDPGAAAALEALSLADAVVLVSDAGRALTASELAFLAAARQLVPTVACALTRTDLHARWRSTASVVAAQVAEAGETTTVTPVTPVIGVSALLRPVSYTHLTLTTIYSV